MEKGYWTRNESGLVMPGRPISAWSLSILGTKPQKLIEDIDGAFGISPDGSAIAFLRGRVHASSETWLMGPTVKTPHKIMAARNCCSRLSARRPTTIAQISRPTCALTVDCGRKCVDDRKFLTGTSMAPISRGDIQTYTQRNDRTNANL